MIEYLTAVWSMTTEMAPWLLFGFAAAGLLHRYLPVSLVERIALRDDWRAIIPVSLAGVPLPLCSCSVLPFAKTLQDKGAGPGSVTAFLTATPQTGVDSFLAASAFFGPVFALYKAAAAFVIGVSGGMLAALFNRNKRSGSKPAGRTVPLTRRGSWQETLRYGLVTVPRDIAPALLSGILLAGLLTLLVPADWNWQRIQPELAYLAALGISLPLYVCATSSLPLAFALLTQGFPAGAAVVLLIAGPATNIATLAVLRRTLGWRTVVIYLFNIALGALAAGWLYDLLSGGVLTGAQAAVTGVEKTAVLSHLSGAVLMGLLAGYSLQRLIRRLSGGQQEDSCSDGCCSSCASEE